MAKMPWQDVEFGGFASLLFFGKNAVDQVAQHFFYKEALQNVTI